jgi:hypothetical protein
MNELSGPPIIPATMDGLLGREFPFQIFQSAEYVAILFKELSQVRIIPWMDARMSRRAFGSGSETRADTGKAPPLSSTPLIFGQVGPSQGTPAENMRIVNVSSDDGGNNSCADSDLGMGAQHFKHRRHFATGTSQNPQIESEPQFVYSDRLR